MESDNTILLCAEDSAQLTAQVAEALELPHYVSQDDQFADGEIRTILPAQEIKGKKVIVIGSTYGSDGPTQDGGARRYEQLNDLMWGAEDFGAESVSVVVPSMGYSTAERSNPETGEVAKGKRRFQRIVRSVIGDNAKALFIGMHTENIAEDLDRTRWVNVTPDEVIGNLIRHEAQQYPELTPDQMCVVAPDKGFKDRGIAIAKACGLQAICGEKERSETEKDSIEVTFDYSETAGKIVFLSDDMIRTGGTIAAVAKECMEAGALGVVLLSAHLILAGEARKKIFESGANKIIGLDTVPGRTSEIGIEVASSAQLIADAVKQNLLNVTN